MKRSELKEFIKGEIFSSLSEASPEEVQNQKELNKELEKTSKLSKEMGLEEANNLLKQDDLSPAEYQKAKKLKGFDPKNYMWDPKQGLYLIRKMNEVNMGLADIEEMGFEAGKEAFENIKSRFKNKPDHQAYRKGFFQGYIDNAGNYGLNEDVDDVDDDKDAVAQAKAARGKHKKLDIAVKALVDITTEMKSLARDYSKADGVEKEKIKDQLKIKTPKKKELEALVAKLEKNVI